jgi:hypothetical protein
MLWVLLILCAGLGGGFHWLALHPERPDVRDLRRYYVGSPSSHAVLLYLATVVIAVLLFLRAQGFDFATAWQ